jgi:Domain of unknown function (DUF4132)
MPNWLDRIRLDRLAASVRQIARIFARPSQHLFFVDGRPIGRAGAAKLYLASQQELAALDAAARAHMAAALHDAFIASYRERCERPGDGPAEPATTAAWRHVLDATPEQRAELAVHAYARFRAITRCPVSFAFEWRSVFAAREMFTTLMRPNLPFSQAQLEKLLVLMTDARKSYNQTGDGAERAILRALERRKAVEELNPEIEKHVRAVIAQRKELARQFSHYEINKDALAFRQRFEALLGDADAPFTLPASPWSTLVQDEMSREPAALQARLRAMLMQASSGRGAQPTQRWLKQAKALRRDADDIRLAGLLCAWVEKLWSSRAGQPPTDPEATAWSTIALHEELGRRLLWMAGVLGCDAAEIRAERFSGSNLLFSGAVTGLSMLDTKGVPALLNLRRKVKGAERKMVDKAIAGIAERQGVPVSTLEETTVPDYGANATGIIELPAGAGMARISLEGSSATLTWINAAGSPKSNPPKAASDAEKQQIAAARARAKTVSDTLKGQAARLEELYLTGHIWPMDVWRKTYVDHPFLAHFGRGLIWSFRSRGERQFGILEGDRPTGVDGRSFDVSVGAEASLWHPFFSTTDVVHAWRHRINALGLVQPFKQAWREIYVLTDAERQTETYSNRFASHVLQQSQFRTLGRLRGWTIPVQGNWDGGTSHPVRFIPGQNITAEFAVGPAHDAVNPHPTNSWLPLLVTDQVRFFDQGGPLPLEEVPPLILSEIFRDLDLLTSVASIGRDPTWVDGGPDRPFAEYWHRVASAELFGTAQTRREALAELLPMLSIADQCSLDDRHLIVRGKLQAYRIHLGSGNIMMMPNNQYLCIVPAPSKEEKRVRLPFEGDGMLSVILSKAFMLADDDKITEQQIINQMKRRL